MPRRKGVGKRLACATIKRARELQSKCLYLETNSRLAPALGLYGLLGFVRKPSLLLIWPGCPARCSCDISTFLYPVHSLC